MSDLNVVALAGRLTRNPELRRLPDGNPIVTFSIAVNDWNNTKKEEVPNFFDIKVWGNRAESCSQYLSKGSQVLVEGKLKQERWKTEGGDSRSKVVVNAKTVQFLNKKKEQQDPSMDPAQNPDLDGKDPF